MGVTRTKTRARRSTARKAAEEQPVVQQDAVVVVVDRTSEQVSLQYAGVSPLEAPTVLRLAAKVAELNVGIKKEDG